MVSFTSVKKRRLKVSKHRRLSYYLRQMSNENSFDQFLNGFRETILEATSRLRNISSEASRNKPSAEDWAPIEILGHLVDSAANNHQRFVRAQFRDDMLFQGYEQNNWVNSQKYLEESWPDLIQLWSSYNLHLHHVASVMPADVLTKPRYKHNLDEISFVGVDPGEPSTIEYFIRDYVDHLQHHLDQIFGEKHSAQ